MKKIMLLIITFLFIFTLLGLSVKNEITKNQEAIELKLIVEFPNTLVDTNENYRVYYVLDGGSNAVFNPRYFTEEELPITLLGAYKENYYFSGWFTESAFTNQVTEINTLGEKTFYAKFEPIA